MLLLNPTFRRSNVNQGVSWGSNEARSPGAGTHGMAPMGTSAEVGVIIKAAIPVEVSVSSMAQDHKSIGVDHQILYGYASIPSSCVFQCPVSVCA